MPLILPLAADRPSRFGESIVASAGPVVKGVYECH